MQNEEGKMMDLYIPRKWYLFSSNLWFISENFFGENTLFVDNSNGYDAGVSR